MSADKSKLSSVHNVADSVKVDPREEYSNVGDRMTVIHYKRLVVPANMRSIYWKCYGFPANEENEILTRTKIVCLLCKTQITYNRNTSNLRMHLQNKHKPELETLELVQPLPHNKGGTTDKRTSKKNKKQGIKQEQVMQVFPASTADEQCFSDNNDKRKRKVKAVVRFGDWVSDKDLENVCEYTAAIAQPDPGIATNSQYMTEVDDLNPLRVIVKEATSNQTYTLVDGKIIAEAISDFIIMDLQSPDVVEGKGFQRLLATLKSPCEIPSKARLIEDIIPKMYDTVRDHLQPQVASLKSDISLSIEDWTATNGDTYSTVSLHFINDSESDLQSKILTTIYCSEVDGLVWGAQFDAMIDEWEIKSDLIRAIIISSDREEIYDSLVARNFTLVPCLSYAVQHSVIKAVFEDPEIIPVLQKCRGLIALINRSPPAVASLRMQESLLQLEDNTFSADNPSIWLSTFSMVEQLHSRKAIMPTVLESLAPTIGTTVNIDFTTAQWELIDDIISVLSPFKVTMVTLAEEKTPLVSLLKPILWQLLHVHLQTSSTDSKSVAKFKSGLSEALQSKYCDSKVNRILDLATILDPRFKTLSFMDESEKPALQKQLKDLLLQQCSQAQGSETKQEHLIKKQRLSGMEFLLGNLCAPKSGMPVQQRAEVELVQYECEAPASLEKSPIDAWKELSSKCVQLSRLAHSYLCTPACVVDHLNRCFTPNPVLNTLPPSLAHKLKFLHRNYNPMGTSQE